MLTEAAARHHRDGAGPALQAVPACSVRSEVAPLVRVLVHRPGAELLRLTPANKDSHLFDDIPWLDGAQREHDAFVDVLRGEGVEVVELADVLAERLRRPGERARFVARTLARAGLGHDLTNVLAARLAELPPRELIEVVLAGVTPADLDGGGGSLVYEAAARTDFLLPPVANLMYIRDAGAVVGETHVVACMAKPVRRLEELHLAAAFGLRPEEAPCGATLEGGDVCVLSRDCVAVGVTERTSPAGVEHLARRLFDAGCVDSVVAVVLPATREAMHLDTVLTMVDEDACTVSAAFRDSLRAFRIARGRGRRLAVEPVDVFGAIGEALGVRRLRVIVTGGEAHAAVREQWNDANNVLAIRPGVVVAYDRNAESNRELRRAGIEVIEIPGSELSRGRGGPHCLSHPLWRSDGAAQSPGGHAA